MKELEVYPSDGYRSLGYDKVVNRLNGKCVSQRGRELALNLKPFASFRQVEAALELSGELLQLERLSKSFPLEFFEDLRFVAERMAVENAQLSESELGAIRQHGRLIEKAHRFVAGLEEEFIVLKQLINKVPVEKPIITLIDRALDEDNQVRSDASPELQSLAKETEKIRAEAERAFRGALQRCRQNGYLADVPESFRNNRRVLAILAEYKRKVSGIVLDESETGRTVYIEPEETVFLNNRLTGIELEIKREIARILRQLTGELRPYAELVGRYSSWLAKMDLYRAMARLGLEWDAHVPILRKDKKLNLLNARHPQLLDNSRTSNKKVVPLSVGFSEEKRILVISGPNAGGKSVCLKTIGLLQMMAQSGMPVPAGDGTELPVFERILTDIGDAQSIENELSTYSSRLLHMRHFLERANRKSLFLIDEFGTGTDPALGGAVAQSLLEALEKCGATGVVTTHYSNLKVFADKSSACENGSMLYDEQNLEPLYRLQTGKPGSSYTFAIARKTGLPQAVINRAEALSNTGNLRFENLLNKVNEEKRSLEKEKDLLAKKQRELEVLQKEYERVKTELTMEKKRIKQMRKEQEQEALVRLEKRFLEMFKLWKESDKAEKAKAADQIRASLRKEIESTGTESKNLAKELSSPLETEALQAGQTVKLYNGNQSGTIVQLKGSKALVLFGELKTWIAQEDLRPSKNSDKEPKAYRSSGAADFERKANFNSTLDLRGKTKEEAYLELEAILDDAVLAGVDSIRIIHGKGGGVLRSLVHNLLSSNPAVREIFLEHDQHGGVGVTVAMF